MSTTTITISTQRDLAERMLGGIASVFKSCFAAYLDWRQRQLDMARLRSMSDFELKDIGIARESIELAANRGWRSDPWAHVNII